MNNKKYGLTKQTLEFYQQVVKHGFNFDVAMKQLKGLYEHNKAFYLETGK